MTSRVSFSSDSLLMLAPSDSPSTSGICMSVMTSVNGSPAALAERSMSRACGAPSAAAWRTPHAVSCSVSTNRFVALSSTMRTLAAPKAPSAQSAVALTPGAARPAWR